MSAADADDAADAAGRGGTDSDEDDAHTLDVQVSVEDPGAAEPALAALLEAAVRRTWEAEGKRPGEVSLTLLGDDAIGELNRAYLHRDGPTDVIAFALGASGPTGPSSTSEGARGAAGPGLLVGDVYVGAQQAARQAGEYGVSLREELVRLAVHGTLHVLGYDHPEGEERVGSEMFRRQEALVKELLAAEPEGRGE